MTEEQVIIVDENDNEIGVVPRSEMRAKNLGHRATSVLVFNSKGEIFVHQRTFEKDSCPGYYDLKAGGVVAAGESYEENALREVEEELGVKGVKLDPLSVYNFGGKNGKLFNKVFKCVYDGPIKLQKEEVIRGRFVSLGELKELIKKEKFAPGGLRIFERYFGGKND